MANLRGPGSMKGVNLIAVTFDNNVTKDGKTRYFDVQVDHRDPRAAGNSNLHLSTTTRKDKDGKDQVSNSQPFSAKSADESKKSQADLMLEANGGADKMVKLENGAKVIAFKADVMPSTRGRGLTVNTKTLEASEFEIDGKILDNQYAFMKAESVKAKEAKSAEAPQADAPEASAPQADAEAETAEAKVDQPSFG